MPATVLLVEDDTMVAEVVQAYLGRAGYASTWVVDGAEGLAEWRRLGPEVVVLDVMLPTLSGLEVLRRARGLGDAAAVILLSALGEEEERLAGLEAGADDYVVKPFSPRELVLRIEALLRRTERLAGLELRPRRLQVGAVDVDTGARVARRDGRTLALTAREFDLLAFLAANPGHTYGKEELLRRVWGWHFGDPGTVTTHVRRLREKLEDDPSDPRILLTAGRTGYRLAPAEEQGDV